jgi:hypothetical protein
LSGSFSSVAPDSLAVFDLAEPEMRASGVLDAEPADLRDRYRRRIEPILLGVELRVP